MIDVNKIKKDLANKIDSLDKNDKVLFINNWNKTLDELISSFNSVENNPFEVLDNKSYKIRYNEYSNIKDEDKPDLSSLNTCFNQIDIGVIIEMLQKVIFEKNYYFLNELSRNNYKYIYNKKLAKYSKEIISDLESLKWR